MKLTDKLKLKFNKNKYVRVLLVNDTGYMNETVVKNDGKIINFKNDSYTFSSKDIIIFNGTPTLMFREGYPKPIDLKDGGSIPEITSSEFNSAINNNVVRDLIKSTEHTKTLDYLTYGLIACIGGIIVLGYFNFQMLDMLKIQGLTIDEMKNTIDTMSNFVR